LHFGKKLKSLQFSILIVPLLRYKLEFIIFQCVASTDLSSDLKESDKSPLTSEILRLLRSIRSGRKDSAETCLELVRKRFLQFIPGKDHDSGVCYYSAYNMILVDKFGKQFILEMVFSPKKKVFSIMVGWLRFFVWKKIKFNESDAI
jgi:hypothetical protein